MSRQIPEPVFKLLNAFHGAVRKATGGRLGERAFGMDVVELHTTGRKSGQRRSVILTTPLRDEARVVLVASKGGNDVHPDWYRNLVANPDVELTIGGRTAPYRARTATGEERAELWQRAVAVYKGYAQYQQRSSREIPVVVCEPR